MPRSKAPAQPHQQMVWIELEDHCKVKDLEERKRLRDRSAELATNMLQRLNEPSDRDGRKFWWSDRYARYCYGGSMGYTVLNDSGEWFNLEYLGRPLEEVVAA